MPASASVGSQRTAVVVSEKAAAVILRRMTLVLSGGGEWSGMTSIVTGMNVLIDEVADEHHVRRWNPASARAAQ